MGIRFSELTNRQLINKCLFNVEGAWDEFYRRFEKSPIKKTIIRMLFAAELPYLANDKEKVEDIFLDVDDAVRIKKGLSTLEDPDKVEPWLKPVSANMTSNWVRKYNSNKNLPIKQAELASLPFSTPQNESGSVTLEDKIKDPRPFFKRDDNELEEYLYELKKLPQRELWALSIKLMFYNPMTSQEVEELSKFLQRSVTEISAELDNMMEALLEENKTREKEMDSAGRIHSNIIHLQNKLFKNHSNPDFDKDKKIDDEIKKKDKRREFLIKSSTAFLGPSNEQIAAIMGLPKEQIQAVSRLVFRAREKLKMGHQKKIKLAN